jgi:hypothetical protein
VTIGGSRLPATRVDLDGYPGEPPWGTLTAIDLDRANALADPARHIPSWPRRLQHGRATAARYRRRSAFIGTPATTRRCGRQGHGCALWRRLLPGRRHARPEADGRQFLSCRPGAGAASEPSGGVCRSPCQWPGNQSVLARGPVMGFCRPDPCGRRPPSARRLTPAMLLTRRSDGANTASFSVVAVLPDKLPFPRRLAPHRAGADNKDLNASIATTPYRVLRWPMSLSGTAPAQRHGRPAGAWMARHLAGDAGIRPPGCSFAGTMTSTAVLMVAGLRLPAAASAEPRRHRALHMVDGTARRSSAAAGTSAQDRTTIRWARPPDRAKVHLGFPGDRTMSPRAGRRRRADDRRRAKAFRRKDERRNGKDARSGRIAR